MSSVSRFLLMACIAAAFCGPAAFGQTSTPNLPKVLRVCADPNNLPYSNDQKQGFENQIADLIAKDFGMQVEYFWFRQGEKFFRRTLNSSVCDIVMGVPTGFDEAATTKPYYRSTYVFITRRDSHLDIASLDDPRLHTLKIGVHILGDANDNTPPVNALIHRGIVKNLVGYSIFGNLNEKDPSADVIRALQDGKVDVAIVWGPLGGYFSRNSSVPLEITPITADSKQPDMPFQFDIGIGVRERDTGWRDLLDRELDRRRAEISAILQNYGIPQAERSTQSASAREQTGRPE
ncbi:substrate-binding domain-containing protein [Occallatibacter riparius]|uniref:Substrate-binding domain-containing protein n=1 Tax=Occallatibacter riparius TaxID=1002689 RepID=A0A9J7BYY0_9BACT|nr:substrate-binding domain-containing protein [Occallatibacter riparius]UWZ86678.1 substrate-binding domain-containing protein [Occallatibacter riparius]